MNATELRTGDRYCIFRAAGGTFGVSALSVREIAERPPLVRAPGAPGLFVGLCHFRNEFLPVLDLPEFVETNGADSGEAGSLLILSGPEGNWALLIDRGLALEALEIAYSASGSESQELVGTASYRDEIVRVLDPDRLYEQAVSMGERGWQKTPRGEHVCSEHSSDWETRPAGLSPWNRPRSDCGTNMN